jgi:cytochrome b6-f complex iron-sulfur subunit
MKKTILLILGLIFILALMLIPQFNSKAQESVFEIGKVGDFPVGAVQLIHPAKALVICDSAGIYAVSAVCTHLGCLIREKKGELVCPCHGSSFDLTGKVLQGPARDALVWYAVEMDTMGNLTLDISKTVPSGTKLAISK